MESNKKPDSYFCIVNGTHVAVTEEVYKLIRFSNNRIHKVAWKERRCAQPNYARCQGDCMCCSWRIPGVVEETDLNDPKYSNRLPSTACVETDVIQSITVQNVYSTADLLVKDGARILQMHFCEEHTVREIATELGVSHTAIIKRLNVLQKFFQKNKDKFI